jgi:hypothetical protein
MVLGGDEVLDGVRWIMTNLHVWSSVSMVPCNGDGTRLELEGPSVVCWTR